MKEMIEDIVTYVSSLLLVLILAPLSLIIFVIDPFWGE